jgi:hypothetical protein
MDNYVEIDVDHLQDELYARKQLYKKQKEELEDKDKIIEWYKKDKTLMNKQIRKLKNELSRWKQGNVQYF